MQEPFRWLIDLGVLKLVLENKIKRTDFINTDGGNIRLKPNAVRLLLDSVAEQFNMETKHKGIKRKGIND